MMHNVRNKRYAFGEECLSRAACTSAKNIVYFTKSLEPEHELWIEKVQMRLRILVIWSGTAWPPPPPPPPPPPTPPPLSVCLSVSLCLSLSLCRTILQNPTILLRRSKALIRHAQMYMAKIIWIFEVNWWHVCFFFFFFCFCCCCCFFSQVLMDMMFNVFTVTLNKDVSDNMHGLGFSNSHPF